MTFMRLLSVAVLLLSLGEVLLAHWALLAARGSGLDPLGWGVGVVLALAFNFFALPLARKRLRGRGLAVMFSRGWILGSAAVLVTSLMLAFVFLAVGTGGLLASTLGWDVATQQALVWLGGLTIALGFGSIAWGTSIGDRRVKIDRVLLPLRGVSPGVGALRIAHITDLHIGPLLPPERMSEFVSRINAQAPDIIVITGDIFDFDPAYIDEGCRALARLDAKHGVFAVLGNHDQYTGGEAVADGLAAHSRIRLLRDEWVRVDLADGSLVIAGVEDPGTDWAARESTHPALDELGEDVPAGLPCLLLAHRPSFFRHAARAGFRLVLAGHTHGGQVAPPLAGNQNISRLIAHWTRGVFTLGESTLYVNRGLGMAGLPLRINCPREIAMIELAG